MLDRPTRSDSLVRRAKDGDRDAFDELLRRSQPRLERLVRMRMGELLRQFEESADVVQSVLAAAVRDLPRFESRGEGSFLRWLTTLVEHKIQHHVRDLKRDRRNPARQVPLGDGSSVIPVAARAPSPSQAAAGAEQEARYRAALERLPEPERELLLLHLELGWSHQEIADALALPSAEAVRKRVARTLARLEALMQP